MQERPRAIAGHGDDECGHVAGEEPRATPRDSLYLSLLLETEILMKKIPSNGFSKWLYKYSHSSFRISR